MPNNKEITAIVGVLVVLIATITISYFKPSRPGDRYNPDVVSESIYLITDLDKARGGGTGFAISAQSGKTVIVTNDHVCNLEESNRILVNKGGNAYMGTILKRDEAHDLCAIEVRYINPFPLALSSAEAVKFDRIFSQGHPLLNPETFSEGRVVGTAMVNIGKEPDQEGNCKPPTKTLEMLFGVVCVHKIMVVMTSMPTFPGNSGSPVLNSGGAVVGVINSGNPRSNFGNYIPLVDLKEFLNGL